MTDLSADGRVLALEAVRVQAAPAGALGTPTGPNNALIAAHALAMNATLVTGDADFFACIGLAGRELAGVGRLQRRRAGLKKNLTSLPPDQVLGADPIPTVRY